MRIKIREGAASAYHHRCYRHAHPSCGMLHSPEWEKSLRVIEGEWIVVETRFLFADQFNTSPVYVVNDKGERICISEQGMRIMMQSVEMIEDDARIGRKICRWCNHHSPEDATECTHCEEQDYFDPLILKGDKIPRIESEDIHA